MAVASCGRTGASQAENPYGNNRAAGRFEELNGIRLYVETYGKGQPMLQIHGNGQGISSMGYQIKFFADRFRVIAADSRGHGKSGMGDGRLTHEKMAEDMNTLLDRLGLKSVHVLGWSDGAIVGLLLAIHHPEKLGKLAIMGANLEAAGAYDWAFEFVARQERRVDDMIARGDGSQPWPAMKQYLDLLGKQPHIPAEDLKTLIAPTLVMAGDKRRHSGRPHRADIHAPPHAQLCIFHGAIHMIPWQNPDLFNKTVEAFFSVDRSVSGFLWPGPAWVGGVR
jgi:pimeloyl-ACP methyl ester carboxylesterase